MTPALAIEGLVLEGPGGAPIVRGVDLTVGAGEIVGLVGESGSGKTQTALAIGRLTPPQVRRTAGQILLDGEAVGGLDERRARAIRGTKVAYIFQEPLSALNPTRRVGGQVQDILSARFGVSPAEGRERALALLASLELNDPARVLGAYPFELSGGMRQRILIALAFLCRPSLIVADEPTTALDVTVQAQVLRLIGDLRREHGVGVLFISHDLAVVRAVCERLYVMRRGAVVETGPVADVLAAPRHPYTRLLLASAMERRRGDDWRDGLRTAQAELAELDAQP